MNVRARLVQRVFGVDGGGAKHDVFLPVVSFGCTGWHYRLRRFGASLPVVLIAKFLSFPLLLDILSAGARCSAIIPTPSTGITRILLPPIHPVLHISLKKP